MLQYYLEDDFHILNTQYTNSLFMVHWILFPHYFLQFQLLLEQFDLFYDESFSPGQDTGEIEQNYA